MVTDRDRVRHQAARSGPDMNLETRRLEIPFRRGLEEGATALP